MISNVARVPWPLLCPGESSRGLSRGRDGSVLAFPLGWERGPALGRPDGQKVGPQVEPCYRAGKRLPPRGRWMGHCDDGPVLRCGSPENWSLTCLPPLVRWRRGVPLAKTLSEEGDQLRSLQQCSETKVTFLRV